MYTGSTAAEGHGNAVPAQRGAVDGSCTFDIARSDGEPVTVRVNFLRANDAKLWGELFENPIFSNWAVQFQGNTSYTLQSVTIRSIERQSDGHITSAFVEPSVLCADGRPTTLEPVLLRGKCHVGLLVILRCSYSRPAGGRPSSWTRDHVLFTAIDRPAIGKSNNLEIMTGNFDETGYFISPTAELLRGFLNTRIHRQSLVLLSQNRVIFSAPEQQHDALEMYLYRQNITEADLAALSPSPEETDNTSQKLTDNLIAENFKLASLGEAWRVTSDAKSMAALFLFHEFRYHNLMPKYRPPNQYDAQVELKKPTFQIVDTIHPAVRRINLRVRIHTPPDHSVMEAGGRENRLKEAEMTVGDASGCVQMKIEQEQLELPNIFQAGTCMEIRNAKIDVLNGHVLLSVDRWGKIIVPSEQEATQDFAFEVNVSNDKSAPEYEYRREDPIGQDMPGSPPSAMKGRRGGRRPRGRRSFRGRGGY